MSQVINSGLFTHRVSIMMRVSSGKTTRGEDTYEWEPFATCYMQARGLTSRESEKYQQLWPNARTMFVARYITGVSTDMRLHDLSTGKMYDIKSAADPDGTFRYLEILGQEIQS